MQIKCCKAFIINFLLDTAQFGDDFPLQYIVFLWREFQNKVEDDASVMCWRLHVPCKATCSSCGYILLSPFARHSLLRPRAWPLFLGWYFLATLTGKAWYAPIHRRLTLRMRGSIGHCSWRALLLARWDIAVNSGVETWHQATIVLFTIDNISWLC